MNKKIDTGRPELHPVSVKSPWYHIGMDFIGPLSLQSLSGNRYILTISDYFTRFGWAKALPSKEAEGVVSALKGGTNSFKIQIYKIQFVCYSFSLISLVYYSYSTSYNN